MVNTNVRALANRRNLRAERLADAAFAPRTCGVARDVLAVISPALLILRRMRLVAVLIHLLLVTIQTMERDRMPQHKGLEGQVDTQVKIQSLVEIRQPDLEEKVINIM